jgi:hypothetical protein
MVYLQTIKFKEMIRRIQFISGALLFVLFFEAILTLGSVFNFAYYTVFEWIAQGIVLTFTITTAIRVCDESKAG